MRVTHTKDPARKRKRRARAGTDVFAPVTAATIAAAEDELAAAEALAATPTLPPVPEIRQAFTKMGLGAFSIWKVTTVAGEIVSIEPQASFLREADADRYLADRKKGLP